MENFNQFKKFLTQGDISEAAYEFLIGNIIQKKKQGGIEEKKISITISTHNRPQTLVRLMDSILMQVYSNFEIVIIDDKSTDDTNDVVNKYILEHPNIEIRYYANEVNIGVSLSKKRGYELCKGDIIIFSDDDDYYIDNLYFSKLNKLYTEHSDCSITTASTLYHFEKDDTYSLEKLNFNIPVDNREYLRGFPNEYSKPGSMFTLSLDARKMKDINYKELKCFNDMSLYLYGALAKGRVYPIVEAVGIYSVQVFSMTSGVSAAYTINNLDAKIDIGEKAIKNGYLSIREKDAWNYKQCISTLMNFFNGNIKNNNEIHQVNAWMRKHFAFTYFIKAYIKEIKARFKYWIRNRKNAQVLD